MSLVNRPMAKFLSRIVVGERASARPHRANTTPRCTFHRHRAATRRLLRRDLFCGDALRARDRHDLPIPPGEFEPEILALHDAAISRAIRAARKFLLARSDQRALEGVRAFANPHATT